MNADATDQHESKIRDHPSHPRKSVFPLCSPRMAKTPTLGKILCLCYILQTISPHKF